MPRTVNSVAFLVACSDHQAVLPRKRLDTGENERVAAVLSGQRIGIVRYFLLPVDDGPELEEWNFGVWHQPTMGVELVTQTGSVFSAIWSQYETWGFGVDLYAEPMASHLVEDAAGLWVEVSAQAPWSSMIGPIEVGFVWNDYGTGRPPCPEAVKVASGDAVAWIVAAGWERQGSRFKVQLGLDDLTVVRDERFIEALGLFDPVRGRQA